MKAPGRPLRVHADDPDGRRRYGRYYTPGPLVEATFRLLAEGLAGEGLRPRDTVLVDPSCGPGAFLSSREARGFRRILGLDLDREALSEAAERAPKARLLAGDAYGPGLAALCREVAGAGPVVVIGNPPYVANSELLRSGRYQAVRDDLLPFARQVARGTSVRDDYVLFFGVADRIIEAAGARGAIAFVTSASFVDNFLYAPLRRWLLSRYRLHALVELGGGLFEGTRVKTALSVWVRDRSGGAGEAFGHLRLDGSVESRLAALSRPLQLNRTRPSGESLLLNAPPAADVRAIDRMREVSDPIGSLFPVSFPGLKTRFEALLVDRDRQRLTRRMRDFFAARDPVEFALRHSIPVRESEKLAAAFAARARTSFSARSIRPFARFAGPRHLFRIPESAMAWAYVDPALIPRGDHRIHGSYDPHRSGPKLVFNAREVPIVAAVVEGEACVHDWRHSRFAPLFAPARVVAEGPDAGSRHAALGEPVLNLAPGWIAAARHFDDPSDLLFFVCGIVNSRVVQELFAPRVGASEEAPIPRIDPRARATARRIAQQARQATSGGALSEKAESLVRSLYGL